MSTIAELPLTDITIPEERQRDDMGDISGLIASIKRRLEAGRPALINPIILNEQKVLCAGFRRYSAHKMLDLPKIAYRFESDLTPKEHEILELEENVHRKQLNWDEEARAIQKIHSLLSENNPKWTASKTATMLGLSDSKISRAVTVISAAEENPVLLESSSSLSVAYNVLKRKSARKAEAQMTKITETILTPENTNVEEPKASSLPADKTLLEKDFLKWAPKYSGPKFNLIHCDFPYGINISDMKMAGQLHRQKQYQDSKEIYWELLHCLAENWDRLITPAAHIIFWYSLRHQENGLDLTRAFFAEHIPQVTLNPFPLIWLKTDNTGVLPDPARGPRQIYETALFGTCGDRKIVRAVSNGYGAPSKKTDAIHQSQKPLPMLKYFLKMLVDETTTLLDPTCGSGTAIQAAEFLGAKRVLGLEKDADFLELAQMELSRQRAIAKLA